MRSIMTDTNLVSRLSCPSECRYGPRTGRSAPVASGRIRIGRTSQTVERVCKIDGTDTSKEHPAHVRAMGAHRNAARERDLSPNQLVVDLAMEALDRREWPSTEAEIRVARASLFAAQVLARDLIAAGRENEVEEIRDYISRMVPDPDTARPETGPASERTIDVEDDDSKA